MSSPPARCEHNRIHRDHTDISPQNKCQVEDIPIWTPKPKNTSSKTQSSQAAPEKRGRGRPRKQPVTPATDSVEFDDNASSPLSPLAALSKHLPRALTSLFTPQATQEDPVEVARGDSPDPAESESASSPDMLQHTPGGTSFVPGTPFDDMPAAEDDGSVSEDILAQQTSPPQPTQDVFASTLALLEHDAVQSQLEIQHLQRSRDVVVEELADKTALANRLRTRGMVYEANAVVTTAELDQTQRDRDAADEHARAARRQAEQVKLRLGSLLTLIVLMVVAYVLWCCYKSPEMEYIRQRRVAVLHE
ncbi:hypothetical protein M409DRAFT_57995 [Zasmidium cellare ATCC 36951]|uniref:Uncharacterized protein n=1 Tax=Zasmidium cellare ATCC 36951 TaxID=1080233 RepID=A0A6A6C703_ZASCE|nr:uncharacterized protein M409DRAFT_57995 [Zasmidium cellare ATCC 36951]KAF2162957.1 hypothetical protein M409DRAFT_57995 [Zasmidium cellare ATCC 36951]